MKKAFVIGDPISHSLSPILHGFWLDKYKIAGTYSAINIPTRELPLFINKLRGGEFVGGNVTIPHKQDIFTHCDEVSIDANEIGAVNTLIIKSQKIYGYNSDWIGFLANLDQQQINWDKDAKQKQAIIIGAGGASRAIIYALMRRKISQIHILNRTFSKANNLSKEMRKYCSKDTKIIAHQFEKFDQLAPNIDIVINTSSIGMHGTKFENISLDKLPKAAIINDIVYTPLLTPLLSDAQKLGLTTIDGLGMLLHQAVFGFENWFGQKPKVDTELRNYILNKFGDA